MKGVVGLKKTNKYSQSEMCSAGSLGPSYLHGDDGDGDGFFHTQTCLTNLNLLYVTHFTGQTVFMKQIPVIIAKYSHSCALV